MTRILSIALMFLSGACFGAAQIASPSADVLGAHLNYGRGCAACHAPHSGASGDGNSRAGASAAGAAALWGESADGLLGKTITTGGGRFVEVLPASPGAGTPDVAGMLMCLSCHDGNLASNAMMRNKIYESLPNTYENGGSVPTLLAKNELGIGKYLNEHPVGLSAKLHCGGDSNWDCTVSAGGTIRMTGPNSRRFVANYGFFVKPGRFGGAAVVVCTTCHEPHLMNVVTVGNNSMSGLPAGRYATMFFLRAPYNPSDTNPLSNQTAQFCRQCHADKSNEMNGSHAGTVF